MRHHSAHELLRRLEGRGLVDQDFADILGKMIAQGTNDDVALLVNQEGSRSFRSGGNYGFPNLLEIFEISLQCFKILPDAGGAGNHAHVWRDIQHL